MPTAQLKVFVSLEAFTPRERERWSGYLDASGGLSRAEVATLEEEATARLLAGRAPLGPDAALVRRAGRRTLVCPLDLDLRAGHALETFRHQVPEVVADAFVPAARTRDHLVAEAVSARPPHILDAPWAVPLHWFVAFSPEERHLTDPPEGRGPHVRFLTTVGQAALRLEHVVEVVETTIEDGGDVLLQLAELASWLAAFPEDAVLELDYARVAATFVPDELRADRTCEELREAVAALEEGDALAAAASFGIARSRWQRRRARHHAS